MNKYSCNCSILKQKQLQILLAAAQTLAVESKLKILLILLNKKHCVCQMQNCLKKEQSLISHHLTSLVKSGWIKQQPGKDGRQIFYSLTKEGIKKLKIFLKILKRGGSSL